MLQSSSNVCHRHGKWGWHHGAPICQPCPKLPRACLIGQSNRALGGKAQRTALRCERACAGTHLHLPHPRHYAEATAHIHYFPFLSSLPRKPRGFSAFFV